MLTLWAECKFILETFILCFLWPSILEFSCISARCFLTPDKLSDQHDASRRSVGALVTGTFDCYVFVSLQAKPKRGHKSLTFSRIVHPSCGSLQLLPTWLGLRSSGWPRWSATLQQPQQDLIWVIWGTPWVHCLEKLWIEQNNQPSWVVPPSASCIQSFEAAVLRLQQGM